MPEAPQEASSSESPLERVHWFPPFVSFLLALAVRALQLYLSSDGPAWGEPLVDGLAHHNLAIAVTESGSLEAIAASERSYFYPAFLAAVYAVAGPFVLAAQVVQAAIGAATCALTCVLGTRLWGRAVGITAGVITAVYGPLFFWDLELVGAGWASFWTVALILLFLRASEGAGDVHGLLLGACSALAVMTRPFFAPVVLFCLVWLLWLRTRSVGGVPALASELSIPVLGFLVIAAPTFAVSYRTLGELRMTAASGGLNLHIGNNAARCETISLRPGYDFRFLLKDLDPAERQSVTSRARHFQERFRSYALDHPADFARGLVHKARQYGNGREVPRNLDIYVFRDWSPLLAVSTWKWKQFGFPWGLIFPLALVALVRRRRDVPGPIWILVLVQPLLVVAVFVAGRYRVPIVPVIAALAALTCCDWVRALREGSWRPVAAQAGAVLCLALLLSLHGPTCEEEPDYRSELYWLLGLRADNLGERERAEELYRTSLEHDAGSPSANFFLGKLLRARGRPGEAIWHLDASIATRPRHPAFLQRCRARLDQGELELAEADCRGAVELDAHDGYSQLYLGDVLFRRGDLRGAARHWRRAREFDPDAGKAARRRLQRLRP